MNTDKRLVVKRGPMKDTVEWAPISESDGGYRALPGAAEPAAPELRENPTGPLGGGDRPWAIFGLLAAIFAFGSLAIAFAPKKLRPLERPLVVTSADLAPVHAGVVVDDAPVRVLTRLAVGDTLETDADGRARMRLDSGTTIIVDRKTKLTLGERGVDVAFGRIFVTASAATEIGSGDVKTFLTGSQAAFDRKASGTSKVYAANGELTVRGGSGESTVHPGESASIDGKTVKVAPEKGFDDWTGGMAAPWAAEGPPRRAVGEIWGRANASDPGSPLTLRSHVVDASIAGETARTEVRSTFFNAGESSVIGDFRMAVPRGALVSRFATIRGERTTEGHIALAARTGVVGSNFDALLARGDVLEWAGDGWLRGTVPSIAAGEAVTVVVSYVEWLSPVAKGSKSQVVQYRYPMVGEADPPTIGEFFAHVDAGPSNPTSLAAGLGARIAGNAVEVRRPDFKPTADLVVDIEMPSVASPARAYVAPAAFDGADPTVIIRTEAPSAEATSGAPPGADGITLALVIDTSTSIDPALLDASKAFVESVTRGLGPRDRLVVLGADQGVRPIGPAEVGPVDDARKTAIIAGLGALTQGGATDLGHSLELAADKLPQDAPDAMVIYVGDGWPTLGDLTPDAIRARLSRRERGAPRLGAVAVGPSANRLILAALTADSGPLIEVGDSSDAAAASVDLLESALVPTVTDVSIDMGAGVERVYPRSSVAVRRGSTITFVGTLRDKAPSSIKLTYRDSKGLHTEERKVASAPATFADDVTRRWAAKRVESIALSGQGREATTDAALRAQLITPWTAWVTNGTSYVPTSLGARVLDIAVGPDLGFNAVMATPRRGLGSLAADTDVRFTEDAFAPLDSSLSTAAHRTLDEARPSFRACRGTRAALRPELSGAVLLQLKLDGDGNATDVKAQGASDNDDAMNRCIETVVAGLVFPRVGATVKVDISHQIDFPPPEPTLRGAKCTPTSQMPLALRRGVFRERIDREGPAAAYLEAKRGCELPNWTAKRSILELTLATFAEQGRAGARTLSVAKQLADVGESEAATFLRKEALRRADPNELSALRRQLLAGESVPFVEFSKQYEDAKDDTARLAVVHRFLALAPHSIRLRGRELAILASLDQKENLVEAVKLTRLDPFADARLLADGASLLREKGFDDEARRTFFEIAERGPTDPWGRAFLGDRLRNEGWFDDAKDDYEVLDDLVPGDAATGLRLALAHAGAGRLDVALRLLSRVDKTGGRTADAAIATLADRLAHSMLAVALESPSTSEGDRARLVRRTADFPALPSAPVVIVRAPAGAEPLQIRLDRGPEKARETVLPDAALPSLGLYSISMGRDGDTKGLLVVSRAKGFLPAKPFEVELEVLAGGKRTTSKVVVPLSGEELKLSFTGDGFVPAK